MMQGRRFLEPARDVARGTSEAYWRAAVVHAYYATFLECRDALTRWGHSASHQQNVHAYVRLRLTYARDADLKRLATVLDQLVRLRNSASYDLRPLVNFTSSTAAHDAIQKATDAISLLDQIDADLTRRAAAIASLPP